MITVRRSYVFSKFILLITILIFNRINLSAQDLTVNQTLDYLNNKFTEFPFQTNYSVWYYTFSITLDGELKIEEKDYNKSIFSSDRGDTSLSSVTTYKIAADKIDPNKSFQSYNYYESEDKISLYPSLGECYYEEKVNFQGIQEYKKSVPSQVRSDYSLEGRRNYISIYLGDAGNKQNIKNALFHLYTLVTSDPIKYGLNRESDPFENIPSAKKTDIISEDFSNTIKIVKTESGLIEVPVILNNVLRINFIFDSGASEVSISPDVAITLFRTKTVTDDDWLPSQTYRFADGSTAKSERFLIRKLTIGNQTLTNIEASISNSIDAPMLIGQNVMQKLGSITIDNKNGLLIIKSK